MSTVAPHPRRFRHLHRLAWLAVALAFGVIVFGAFVRLSHAGLSCPDWPTCYGRATWPKAAQDVSNLPASAIRVFEDSKAWREQVHRHLAATLGFLVLLLALFTARARRLGVAQVLLATGLIVAAIFFYISGAKVASQQLGAGVPWLQQQGHLIALLLAGLGEVILLAAAWRWSNSDLSRIGALLLATIVFQALLGMWTVTWLLKPVVVMGHLLGGMTTFALLAWMAWRATDAPLRSVDAAVLRRMLWIGLAVIAVQIALGGWVSANYAAMACGTEFPKCLGQWMPPHDFREAFVLWRGIGVDYEGGVLDAPARSAIQFVHRGMAVIVLLTMAWMVMKLLRQPGLRGWAVLLGLATCVQIALGIANVLKGLPLPIAVMHNGGAALLLFVVVTLLARLQPLQQVD